jgi:hypothetical protein
MDPDVLREQLTQLHQELGVTKSLDPRSAQLLGEILGDIKRLLEPSAEAPGGLPDSMGPTAAYPAAELPVAAAPRSLSDRVEQVEVQFEVDHPTLAASLRRLVELLATAGL